MNLIICKAIRMMSSKPAVAVMEELIRGRKDRKTERTERTEKVKGGTKTWLGAPGQKPEVLLEGRVTAGPTVTKIFHLQPSTQLQSAVLQVLGI